MLGNFLTYFLFVCLILGTIFPDRVFVWAQQCGGSIVYTRDQLLSLQPTALIRERPEIPRELRRKYRGRKAGRKHREKKRRYKPSLPSITMGNVRSLANKMDELAGLVRTQRVYRESSVLCFTETWLHEDIPDSIVSVDGFQTVRADRSHRESGKRKGGGLAILINNKWCHPGHVTVKERVCSPDIELLAMSLRPYYLPREFSHVILLVVYIPPSANAARTNDVIHTVVASLQTRHPDAFIAISGDLNHTTLGATLPTFKQFVDCPTRENKTLDLLYANVKEAYSSTALPPLGRSDHNLIHLQPLYKPQVQRLPVTTRTVRRWSQESDEALQGCFELTDWELLRDSHGEDLDDLTDCITGYINFCVDSVVPTVTVRCFPNNKPWVTRDIKVLLNEKKRAFRDGDREQMRQVQRELKVRIQQGKDRYRRKLEHKLQQNNLKDVWSGMRGITGYKQSGSQTIGGGTERANELNLFFNRFDERAPDYPSPSSSTTIHLQTSSPAVPPTPTSTPPFLPDDALPVLPHLPSPPPTPTNTHGTKTFTAEQVRKELSRLRPGKAAGPDGVSPRVLKTCAAQLSGVLQHIFNLSLRLERVPVLWKTSCLVPVPKKTRPSTSNDYRPVALTSYLMKSLERLVLSLLRPLVSSSLDPLQFAYQPQLGVEDAIIFLLHQAGAHLDRPGSTVRIMFFDFSSAFNTIRPALLGNKLTAMQVDPPLVSWIMDYLTGRPQYVRLQDGVSETVVSNTGAPQGTVLSPFLFTLYTSDFQFHSESCHLQKFADDSAIVGCISEGNEEEYRGVVDSFVEWCGTNHLHLNTTKTKELVVDFRRRKSAPTPISINGATVDVVSDYKYLGVHLDNKLDWAKNTEAVYKKGQSRLYFLRRLRSFNVCNIMLRMFYQSVVASAIFFGVACWGSRLRAADANRIGRIIRKAGSVLGVQLDSLLEVSERRMLCKLHSILDNNTHPLHQVLTSSRSTISNRLIPPRCNTERQRKSFLPVAIRLFNSSTSGRERGSGVTAS